MAKNTSKSVTTLFDWNKSAGNAKSLDQQTIHTQANLKIAISLSAQHTLKEKRAARKLSTVDMHQSSFAHCKPSGPKKLLPNLLSCKTNKLFAQKWGK